MEASSQTSYSKRSTSRERTLYQCPLIKWSRHTTTFMQRTCHYLTNERKTNWKWCGNTRPWLIWGTHPSLVWCDSKKPRKCHNSLGLTKIWSKHFPLPLEPIFSVHTWWIRELKRASQFYMILLCLIYLGFAGTHSSSEYITLTDRISSEQ